MPGGLTTDIKSLEANGSTVASAQAGDIVGFTVTAPLKFVRPSAPMKLLFCAPVLSSCDDDGVVSF